jgi:hypothetical protein
MFKLPINPCKASLEKWREPIPVFQPQELHSAAGSARAETIHEHSRKDTNVFRAGSCCFVDRTFLFKKQELERLLYRLAASFRR